MNIFDLRGPEFLSLYVELLGGAVLFVIIWRWTRRGPSDAPDLRKLRLDAFDLAYLARGEGGLVQAVVASLVHKGLITVKPTGRIDVTGSVDSSLHRCEAEAYGQIKAQASPRIATLRGKLETRSIRQKLIAQGLIVPDATRVMTAIIAASAVAIIVSIGLIKILVGISRDRPVGFLCLLVAAAFVLLVLSAKLPLRSRSGDAALGLFRKANSTLHTTALADTKTLSASDVVIAFSLWGMAALSGEAFATMRAVLAPPSRAWGTGGSSCGGASSCGGGSCGGGGCGGGGCGGCGS
jgi:uncharacterized protein (TIGR04222 family)